MSELTDRMTEIGLACNGVIRLSRECHDDHAGDWFVSGGGCEARATTPELALYWLVQSLLKKATHATVEAERTVQRWDKMRQVCTSDMWPEGEPVVVS